MTYHGGSRDGVGGGSRSNPCGEHANTWGEDVEDGTEVGEAGTSIILVNGADGNDCWLGGWGDVGSVLVLVTGSDDGGDTSSDSGLDGVVAGSGVRSSKRHGDDRLGSSVGDSPLNTRDNTRAGSLSAGVENLDCDEGCLLSNTVGGTSDGTGTVSTVSVTISV